ncbi:MAG: transcriptional regulator PpsR [Pseudomonadota bacterium]
MSQGTQERTIGHFESPELFLAGLDADVAGNLIAASADVVLIVDDAGVIRDMAFGSDELLSHGYQDWLGKPWAQTVTLESRPKIEAMLSDAHTGAGARWRHVNHPSADGADLPLSYSVMPVRRKGKSHEGRAHSVAFGRDLRAQVALQQRLVSAQLSMERDYWRLRHVETRYRLLFQVASEAVLILDANTEKLEEANPAAYTLLGDKARRSGWTLAESLEPASSAAVRQMLATLRSNGRCEPLAVRLAETGDSLTLSASLFRQENSTHFLIRLSTHHAAAEAPGGGAKQLLLSVMESAPDAFVVTDLDGRVLSVNRAFLELAQLASEELVRGESLEKWLGRTGVDLNVLISNLRQRGAVRLFATSMRGEYGSTADVEISAVAVTGGDTPCLGFTIRDVGRRLSNEARGKELPRSAGQMTELVGRVPLKDIVRETTDLIEQLCIEAALELTGDNRASAAEMLGLSRQSLYVKLRRFGIGDAVAEGQDSR